MKRIPLKIVPFKNPGGSMSWRVTGTLPAPVPKVTDPRGRVQKNFPDRGAAEDFVSDHTPTTNGKPQPVSTHLPPAVVRRCEVAVGRLPPGADIVQAVDFFAEYHRPLVPLTLEDAATKTGAITAFTHWLDRQRKNELVTITQREIVLKHFARTTNTTRTDGITVARARAWIYARELEDRTQRDRFDLLNFFCDWLVKNKHAATNPVTELDRPVVKVDAPGVHSFDETWTLLQCALTDAEGPQMLPFFAICELSGLRPHEVPRLSRDAGGNVKLGANGKPDPWADFYLDDEHRIIEVNKAKGGRSRRNATIHEALWRILKWCKARGLDPTFFSRRKFRRIRRRAGLDKNWEKDIARHTYASHRYVLTKDIKELEGDMGNSERVLFQNYIRPVPLKDGQRMAGLILHYSAPVEESAMGSGPKPRKKSATPKDGAQAAG